MNTHSWIAIISFMKNGDYETVIIGMGLAGATLAWQLHLRHESFLLIDQGSPSTPSRIAAGLITPITGPKLAITWNWHAGIQSATTFYNRVSEQIGQPLLVQQPALHLFRSESEKQLYEKKLQLPEFRSLVCEVQRPPEIPAEAAPFGLFLMPHACRLNIPLYLTATREMSSSDNSFIEATVDPENDIRVTPNGIEIPSLNVRSRRLIFCNGFHNADHPWFGCVRFQPSKGEILTLSIPNYAEPRSVHATGWLAEVNDGNYMAGSTFEWKELNSVPTATGKSIILNQLAQWLRKSPEVIEHHAAVRPTMNDFRPVIGRHPEYPQLSILNGLGTRGSLLAPWLAKTLLDNLDHSSPIPAEMNVQRWFRSPN
ncbi:NAD(P)/FAD-dependent oxidoreductase [Planctomicrobium sp. SH668]|uniref:NAD(P)/FAD-dependent oxidoreductase n=1 Tax=Planctomicrobium sp. SH668 TaxID=3448126 RepID=UPI003F5AF2BF